MPNNLKNWLNKVLELRVTKELDSQIFFSSELLFLTKGLDLGQVF